MHHLRLDVVQIEFAEHRTQLLNRSGVLNLAACGFVR
jgi:hypothetical protein